jgi:CelD/BcsL family acetyltransferase involved in cellulose biosynthesis
LVAVRGSLATSGDCVVACGRMTSVVEINDVAQLGELRDAWRRLLAQTPGGTFFQSLEWLETYWKHYAADQRLRVLLVKSVGELVGILPLVERSEKRRIGSMRFLTYPLDHWGSFYGPIGPRPEPVLLHGMQHIRRTKRAWDAVDLRFVDADGHDGGAAERALRAAGMTPFVSNYETTTLVDLPPTWDEFLTKQTSKWRNNYRRWVRKVEECGELSYARHRPRGTAEHGDDDPRFDLYDACEDVARRSWQEHSETGTTLSSESIRPFLRDLHAVASRFGAADVNLLYLDGRAAAFAYNYHYRGGVFGLRIGFDADAASDGLGNLMYLNALRDSIERGDRLYDLGPGSLECKRYLGTRVQQTYRLSYYRRTSARGQFVRIKNAVQRWKQGTRSAPPIATRSVSEGSPSEDRPR